MKLECPKIKEATLKSTVDTTNLKRADLARQQVIRTYLPEIGKFVLNKLPNYTQYDVKEDSVVKPYTMSVTCAESLMRHGRVDMLHNMMGCLAEGMVDKLSCLEYDPYEIVDFELAYVDSFVYANVREVGWQLTVTLAEPTVHPAHSA